jgi:hypothetical protein
LAGSIFRFLEWGFLEILSMDPKSGGNDGDAV